MMSFEDQVFNKEFRNAYQNLKAPEDLKKDTLKRMLAEEEHLEKKDGKAHKGKRRTAWYYGTAAAAFCAVLLVIAVLRQEGISYITPMEEGVFYDEVELENGMIRFLPGRVVISISPNAGQAGAWQGESISGLLDEEARLVELTESESGGELKFLIESSVPVPEIDEDSWSYIGEQKIYVSVLKTEGMRYQAVYEKNHTAYEVIGTNVTQKEFIDYLYQKIKKEK